MDLSGAQHIRGWTARPIRDCRLEIDLVTLIIHVLESKAYTRTHVSKSLFDAASHHNWLG